MSQRTDKAARMERLEASRAVTEKLATINDPDVSAYLDRLDKAYSDQILDAAIKPGDEARILAMRRDALRYIRNLITGAPAKLVRIKTEMAKINNAGNNDAE